MFGIDASEFLIILIVAVVVIGPKDMPTALRAAGRWIGKMRKMSSHFRAGIDAMVREAELEDMEKKWKEQNAKVMREHPMGSATEMEPTGAYPPKKLAAPPPAGSEAEAQAKEKARAHEAAQVAKRAQARAAGEDPDAPAGMTAAEAAAVGVVKPGQERDA